MFISEKEPQEKYFNVALTYIDLNIMTFAFFSHFQVIKEELAPLINNNKREYKQMVYYAEIFHTRIMRRWVRKVWRRREREIAIGLGLTTRLESLIEGNPHLAGTFGGVKSFPGA